MTGNAAIFFHPEGFDTKSPKLMGRHAAGEGFLRGWVRHGGFEALHCQVGDIRHAEAFGAEVRALGWRGPVHAHRQEMPETLSAAGGVILPGPNIGQHAWARRARVRPDAFSVLGLTHTTASSSALDHIGDLLIAPVEEWDALICTSQAVKSMVVQTLTDQASYLAERLSVPSTARLRLPQLPVIPLGVACDRYEHRPDLRQAWRDRLAISEADVAVLFMGRLSFHAKAHPMAMYTALQNARSALPPGGRLHLIEAGWFASKHIQDAYDQAVALLCPDIVHHVLDGRDHSVRDGIWHAADIFCSLSDNIQETFGLTPIEAMAAGLPCVVSDWNGYKETVRDGIDGFRVSTWMLPSPLGTGMAERHALGVDSYDMYCGKSCQFVSVDVEQTTQAFRTLIADPGLRRRMGDAGRRRSRETFDWRVVVGAYKDLLTELAARRARAAMGSWKSPPLGAAWPLRPDPFRSFAHYPTHLLALDTLVGKTEMPADRLEAVYTSGMVNYAHAALPGLAVLKSVLSFLPEGAAVSVRNLAAACDAGTKASLAPALLFLAKYDFVRLSPHGGDSGDVT
ncbi:glycosyltransferase family 4 protein [Niveispirillum sp.]|uniref:glycosyltransferase family 4 protein n=1 Tax=Niveispirillum sp. TaxID=1917217 RepID=UPI001B665588|nr:glycosyltransferase family 4 protein [Niveispirillum sp.]MBP7334406.1 glycosyltransferase family 4 protein [Niveispirillum sp.]